MSLLSYAMAAKHIDKALSPSDHFVYDWVTGDEAPPIAIDCTVTEDTQYTKTGLKSWRLTTSGAVRAHVRWEFPATHVRPNALGIQLYIEDVSKVTGLWLDFLTSEGHNHLYGSSTFPLPSQYWLKTGWNYLRWSAHNSGSPGDSDFGTWERVRVIIDTTEATAVVIDRIWMEGFEKAKLIMIHDGNYASWIKDRGYRDLFVRRLPVTMAAVPGFLGQSNRMSEAELLALAKENDNEISIHSWAAEDLDKMDDEELYEGCLSGIDWLRERSLEGRIWRAAWYRNNAPAAASPTASVRQLFQAYAMPGGGLSQIERVEPFPPADRWNIKRIMLHARTEAGIDDLFDVLKKTRGIAFTYTHTIMDGLGGHTPEARWDYFLGKIDEAVAEGWLEGTTFSKLLRDNWEYWRRVANLPYE